MELTQVNVGYSWMNLDAGNQYKSFRQSELNRENWAERIRWNLSVLESTIRYNRALRIPLYGISPDLLPFSITENLPFDWEKKLEKEFESIKQFLWGKIRIVMEMGSPSELSSPDEKAWREMARLLEHQVRIMELMGTDPDNKLILRISAVNDDKAVVMERFIERAASLDATIRARLVLENDEKNFNIADVLKISQRTGFPVVFSHLAHQYNPSPEGRSMAEWIQLAGQTWGPGDGRQIIRYSQQAVGKLPGTQSDTIAADSFMELIQTLAESLDVLLEAQDSNRSAEKIQMILQRDVKLAERLWARSKYSVLARSQPIYREIRMLLKDKSQPDFLRLARLLEQALNLPESTGDAVNAAEHVWGYFKNRATDDERQAFRTLIEGLASREIPELTVREYLYNMLRKYPHPYLQASYYFKEADKQADKQTCNHTRMDLSKIYIGQNEI